MSLSPCVCIFFSVFLGPFWSWWGTWNAWRAGVQGTLCHHTTFYLNVMSYKLQMHHCFHCSKRSEAQDAFAVLRCSLVCWHLYRVPLQGDRGFDGLPGLPGEKGHRVSCHKFKSCVKICHQNCFLAIYWYIRHWHLTPIFFFTSGGVRANGTSRCGWRGWTESK